MVTPTPTTTVPGQRVHAQIVHAATWAGHHEQPLFVAAVATIVAVWIVTWRVGRWWRLRQDDEASWSAPVKRLIRGEYVNTKKVTRRDGRIVYMRLHYSPDSVLYGPGFASLEANLSEQLGVPVKVDLEKLKRRIHLRLAAPVRSVEDTSGKVGRAQTVARQLLGPEAQVESPTLNLDGTIEAFVVTHRSIKDADQDFRKTVDNTIQSKLGQRFQPQWEQANDRVVYRSTPDLPTRVPHPAITGAAGHAIPFGVDANGHTVAWDLDSDAPHCLVVGATGSGKSSTILTILTEASWFADIRVADYKRISLRGLKNWPGVTRIALDLDDIADLLITAEADMMARVAAIEREEIDEDEIKPIIIVMEEGTATILKLQDAHRQRGGEDGKPGKGEAPAKVAFDNLVLLGRQPHLHLLLAAQRPDAKIIDGAIRDQFGCRVLLGRPKRGTHTMMELDEWITTGPRGRGVADTGTGAKVIQGWWTPDPSRYAKLSPDDKAIIDGLRPAPAVRAIYPDRPVTPQPQAAPRVVAAPQLRVVTAEVDDEIDEDEWEPDVCPDPPDLKRCTVCQRDLPLPHFGTDRHKANGLNVRCKECDRELTAARRAAKRKVSLGAERAP